MGSYLRDAGHPVLLDAGTLAPDGRLTAAAVAADLLLWFVRPTREELLVLRHRLAECPQPDAVGVVLVGDVPYNAEQVHQALGVEVVHVLPIDSRAATAANLGGDDRFLRRSGLARSCARLAEVIQHRVWRTIETGPAPEPAVVLDEGATPDEPTPDDPDVAPPAEVEVEVEVVTWRPDVE